MKLNHEAIRNGSRRFTAGSQVNGVDRIGVASDAPDSFPVRTTPEPCVEDEAFPPEAASSRESPSVLTLYLREIGRVKLLSREEEVELARRVQNGDDDAREQMIKANLRLVVRIARNFVNLGLPLLDLISEGNLGLMKAVEQFDPAKGAKLSAYASFRIRAHICRALSNFGRTIRLPVHARTALRFINSATIRLQAFLDREPTQAEIARESGLPVAEVKRILEAIRTTVSLDETFKDREPGTMADMVVDENSPAPNEGLTHGVAIEQLREFIGQLKPRERTVLRCRFGLDGEDEKTLEQVARHLGLTRERIRQIQNGALARLRKKIRQREAALLSARCGVNRWSTRPCPTLARI